MRRIWVAALLALAACASVLAAEDTVWQKVLTIEETTPDDSFTVTFTFDEAVEDFSADKLRFVVGDDGKISSIWAAEDTEGHPIIETVTPGESFSGGGPFNVPFTFSDTIEVIPLQAIDMAQPLLVGVEDGRNRTQTLEIFEDMRVFYSVLSDLIEQEFPEDYILPIRLRIHSVYLGRGCLYLVDFPSLLVDSRPSRADAETDAVWEAARQRMGVGSSDSSDETYDAERASKFVNAVLSALKHASNMRHFADADLLAVYAMSGGGLAPTYFSARAEFGSLASPSTASGRIDVSTAQGGAVVMARVLDKTLHGKLGGKYSMGRPGRLYTGNPSAGASGAHPGKGARGVYLEGYGVLFVADVRFPLAPRREDDLWEQSARELRGGRRANRWRAPDVSEWTVSDDGKTYTAVVTPVIQPSGSPVIVRGGGFSTSENEKQLKDLLTEGVWDALKYASRIQGMDAEEYVAVLIRGAEGTQISFRALKRDLDAYGKGELTREQFQEKLRQK